MKGYLSGPMTGMPQYNKTAFVDAAKSLRKDGIDVISPVELDEADGASLDDPNLPDRYWRFLGRDVQTIGSSDIDAMFVLAGWQMSVGARLEVFQALLLNIPIYSYETRRAIFKYQAMMTISDSLGLTVINPSIRQDH